MILRFDGPNIIVDVGKTEATMPPKEEIRKQIGRSPDYSDSLVIALSRKRAVQGQFRTMLGRVRAPMGGNGYHANGRRNGADLADGALGD